MIAPINCSQYDFTSIRSRIKKLFLFSLVSLFFLSTAVLSFLLLSVIFIFRSYHNYPPPSFLFLLTLSPFHAFLRYSRSLVPLPPFFPTQSFPFPSISSAYHKSYSHMLAVAGDICFSPYPTEGAR